MSLARFLLILLCALFFVMEAIAIFINLLVMFETPSLKTFLILCLGVVFMVLGVRWLTKIFRGVA